MASSTVVFGFAGDTTGTLLLLCRYVFGGATILSLHSAVPFVVLPGVDNSRNNELLAVTAGTLLNFFSLAAGTSCAWQRFLPRLSLSNNNSSRRGARTLGAFGGILLIFTSFCGESVAWKKWLERLKKKEQCSRIHPGQISIFHGLTWEYWHSEVQQFLNRFV